MARPTVRSALPWAVVDAGTTAITAGLGLLVLSRLLEPSDFGVVALAQAIVVTVRMFTAAGIREALIRQRPVDVAWQDSAHWLAVALGIAGFLGCAALALIIALFGQVLIAQVLATSAVALVLGGLSILPEALLTRELRTAALARRTMLSKAVYTVAACGLAVAGWGLWSIVAATLLQAFVSTASLWAAQQRAPALRARAEHVRQILAYGWAVTAETLLWSLTGRSFVLLVGVVHGVHTLGYVNLAMRSVEVFSALLTSVNSRFSLPLFSRAQGSPELVGSVFARATEVLNLASAPVFIGLALTAGDWAPLFLGEKWLPAVPLVQAFALTWVLVFTRMLAGDCVRIAGHPRALLAPAVVAGTMSTAAVLLTAGQSLLTIVYAWASRTVLTVPMSIALVRRYAGLSLGRQLQPLVRPALCALTLTGAVLAARALAPWGEAAPGSWARLATDMAVGGVAYAAAAALLFRNELRSLRRRA